MFDGSSFGAPRRWAGEIREVRSALGIQLQHSRQRFHGLRGRAAITALLQIIGSAAQHPGLMRLVLGSVAYRFVTAAVRERLAQVEPQESAAASTDWVEPQ
ncbi:hypothetical protein [Actinoplanes sp. NPDC020271]|uniref:hypothetical protein n=1 Tax=Actinoplanes sp. NPDC020271 TaxID=3363896 RepID=UPI0037B1E86F